MECYLEQESEMGSTEAIFYLPILVYHHILLRAFLNGLNGMRMPISINLRMKQRTEF